MSEAEAPRRRNLGRGLSALLGEAPEEAPPVARQGAPGSGLRVLPVAALKPGRFQPRREFKPEAIAELADSIREKGVLQPILARPDAEGGCEIVAGERRWRAAQLAGLHEVPVLLRAMSDREALEAALVENLQRQDLSPLEEAEGYRRLMGEFGHTQDELARQLGKSRSHLANMMRLLNLPPSLKHMLEEGSLTAGHARALLTAADPEALARQVAARGLSVRETERLAQRPALAAKPPPPADPDARALERDLAEVLGIAVQLRARGETGELVLRYRTLEQLDDLVLRLSQRPPGAG